MKSTFACVYVNYMAVNKHSVLLVDCTHSVPANEAHSHAVLLTKTTNSYLLSPLLLPSFLHTHANCILACTHTHTHTSYTVKVTWMSWETMVPCTSTSFISMTRVAVLSPHSGGPRPMLSVCAVPGHLRTHRSYTTDQVSGVRNFRSLITHSVAWKQTPDPIKLLIEHPHTGIHTLRGALQRA